METKQIIVMRKDLNMRKGKMVAQGCHASCAVFANSGYQDGDEYVVKLTKAMQDWIRSSFKKICVYVNSEDELHAVYQAAKNARLPAALIRDAGHTEFNMVPTYTCCAIGPAYEDELEPITGHLPLL